MSLQNNIGRFLSAVVFLSLVCAFYGATWYTHTGAYAYISTPAVTTTTEAGTYYRLEGTFTNEISNGFSIVGDKLTYSGQTQLFEIKVCASFQSDTVNTEITMALYKSGVLQTNSLMTVEVDATTDIHNIALIDVIELADEDNIEIRIKSDKAGAEITAVTGNTSANVF